MRKDNVIQNAISILQKELIERGELLVSIVHMRFAKSLNENMLNGEFSHIRADRYDEGFYLNTSNNVYYYYGEAISENEGSFSNKFSFPIEGADLELLPLALRQILAKVAISGKTETIKLEEKDTSKAIEDNPLK